MSLKVTLPAVVLFFCSVAHQAIGTEATSKFSLLTYNIAAVYFSESNPVKNVPIISPKLNAFDIAVFQEDFLYHPKLVEKINHPYLSTPSPQSLFNLGDGLNQIARFEFSPRLYREIWENCSGTIGGGHYSDCLTSKGFSDSKIKLDNETEVTLINVHLDAGAMLEDFIARLLQITQLTAYLKQYHEKDPLIVAGDWNIDLGDAKGYDMFLYAQLTQAVNLIDVCHELRCGIERVDRVFYRSNTQVQLQPISWKIPDGFFDEEGTPLSDHDPVAVEFNYLRVPML